MNDSDIAGVAILLTIGGGVLAGLFTAFGWPTLLVLVLMSAAFVGGFFAHPHLAPRLRRYLNKEDR